MFKNFRGRGNDKTGTIFIKIDAGDNTFDNCDFVNWQVGMELNSFSVVSNFHGFISQTALYSDSCFIKLNAGAQMSNLYPDTQRYVFGIGGYSLQISISNLVLVFNESIIGSSITDSKPPKVFEPDVSYAKTKNILITNMSVHAPIYTNSNVFSSGGSVGIAVINFAVGSNLNRYNIKCPGVSGDNATEKATFNSALYDGRPVIRPNGYIDVITATDDISENDVLCKFNLNGGWTPVESATPCIISDSTGENHRQRIVVTKKDESGKIAVYAPDNIETGEKLYVNIPAEFHPTTYT